MPALSSRMFSPFFLFFTCFAVVLAGACGLPFGAAPGVDERRGGDNDVDVDDDNDDDDDDDPGCVVDVDCAGGEVCDDAVCVVVCDADDDCRGGEVCRDDRCVAPACVVDADCPGGFFCDDVDCVAFDGCVDGDVRCVDDNTAGVCDGGRERALDCAAGTLCFFGVCEAIGEGEGEGAEGEGEGGEGEGEGAEPCVEFCVDERTVHVCFFNTAVEQACAAGQVCNPETARCVDADGCIPDCGARVCGPDPDCGESCGVCTDTCTSDGRCVRETPANAARIEVIASPVSGTVAPWLSRRSSGSFCDVDDSCSFRNCTAGAALRPDWDNDPNSTLGDPLYQSNIDTIDVVTPAGPQTYRVGVQNRSDGAASNVTLEIAVDGVNVFGATKRLNPGQLWTGVTLAWNGSTAQVTRADAIVAGFSCGGEACDVDDDCADGFVCTPSVFSGEPGTCNACDLTTDCGSGRECRHAFCIDDTTDGIPGEACSADVDCVSTIGCLADLGVCGEACDTVLCTLFPDLCCASGGSCSFDGVCLW
jgi:hypothetical protein